MKMEIHGSYIFTKIDSDNNTIYYWSDRPFYWFSKLKRISKKEALTIQSEQKEVTDLIQRYISHYPTVEECSTGYTVIFYLLRGEIHVTFQTRGEAVTCSRYVSHKAKLFLGFVVVWKGNKWVHRIWKKKNIDEPSETAHKPLGNMPQIIRCAIKYQGGLEKCIVKK